MNEEKTVKWYIEGKNHTNQRNRAIVDTSKENIIFKGLHLLLTVEGFYVIYHI